jgi:4-amino-4-deoxy-L-arabinose transferase-like glycosyltransferase
LEVRKLPPTRFPKLRSLQPSSGQVRSRPGPWALPAALLISLIWRVPSLFDPPWVNDEGTYFAVAQAISHGYRLYAGVWENKPPAIYVLYAGVYQVLGPSLVGVRTMAALAVLGLVALVYAIAGRYLDRASRLAASLFAGLLLGTPFLEGTTANAEVFLAFLSALGVWAAIDREHSVLGGVALGLAVLFKAVAGFDAAALGIWLFFNDRSRVRPYAAGLLVVLGATLAACTLAGILPDMLRDALLYDLGYVGQGNGGRIPALLLVKLAILAALTVILRRREFPYLWLVYSTAGALFSGRIFGHYMLQLVPALCIVIVMVIRPPLREAGWLAVLPSIFLGLALACAFAGWILNVRGDDSIFARRLQYYANFARYALRTESRQTYQSQVDDHVSRNVRIARALGSLPSGRVLVWGNTPWIYPLSDRLPATKYTSALRNPPVPHETADLRRALRSAGARELVIIYPPAPLLGSAAESLSRRYREVERIGNAVIYVSARLSESRLASASTTARARKGTR